MRDRFSDFFFSVTTWVIQKAQIHWPDNPIENRSKSMAGKVDNTPACSYPIADKLKDLGPKGLIVGLQDLSFRSWVKFFEEGGKNARRSIKVNEQACV
jgi:hypothetical protein